MPTALLQRCLAWCVKRVCKYFKGRSQPSGVGEPTQSSGGAPAGVCVPRVQKPEHARAGQETAAVRGVQLTAAGQRSSLPAANVCLCVLRSHLIW